MNNESNPSKPAEGAHAALPWAVYTIDNFFRSPTDKPECCGQFATFDEAAAEGRRLLRECLDGYHVPGMSAPALFAAWEEFGEEVVIRPKPQDRLPFWSWAVVGELAVEMVAAASTAAPNESTTHKGDADTNS